MMTIRHKTYSLFCFLLLFTGFVDLHGQFKDFQTWCELELNKEITGKLDLPGVAIAEIKFENQRSGSSIHAAMRTYRIRPRQFSKYAIGMALLHPGLKQNRLKSKVRKVHQINDSYHVTPKNHA